MKTYNVDFKISVRVDANDPKDAKYMATIHCRNQGLMVNTSDVTNVEEVLPDGLDYGFLFYPNKEHEGT